MFHAIIKGSLAAIGLTALLAGVPALAQDTVRVRGTIEHVDGSTLTVKSRDGHSLKINMPDNVTIVALVKATLADIKQGSFVGITGMPQPDGSQKALEVHIFPESMRGTGEGHRPWDLQPSSTMTNANVEQVVTAVEAHTLHVKYADGEKKITVPSSTPIVTYSPGNRADLKPGVKIFIAAATRQADGTLTAPRINYGKDNLTPPM